MLILCALPQSHIGAPTQPNHKQIITHTIGLLSYPFPRTLLETTSKKTPFNRDVVVSVCPTFHMKLIPLSLGECTSASSRHHANSPTTVDNLPPLSPSTYITSTQYSCDRNDNQEQQIQPFWETVICKILFKFDTNVLKKGYCCAVRGWVSDLAYNLN